MCPGEQACRGGLWSSLWFSLELLKPAASNEELKGGEAQYSVAQSPELSPVTLLGF